MSVHEEVQVYFERASQLFNSIYTGEKSSFGQWLDKVLRPDLKERFVRTLNAVQSVKPKSLLDVGVGPGQYLKAYIELGVPRITALDFSQPMLDLAQKLAGEIPEGQSVEYVLSDFMKADLKDKYDISVAMGVFDYIPEPGKFLQKMKYHSNHSVLTSFPSISLWRTPIRKIRYAYKRCPVFFYRQSDIEKLARECGFVKWDIVKIKGSGMDYWVQFFC